MTPACYVYCVVDVATDLPAGLHGLGPSGEVRAMPYGNVSAVIGDVPDGRVGGRDDLLAHHRVVEALAVETDVVPMRFGSVLPHPDAVVADFLDPQHDRLTAALAALRGQEQHSLEVRYDTDTILREIVAAEPEVARLRRATHDRHPDALRPERMRLGELIVAGLERRRAVDAAQIVELLGPLTTAVAPGEPSDPEVILRAAFLVARGRRREFEAAVESVGEGAGGRLRLRLTGPQPPYDFVGGR